MIQPLLPTSMAVNLRRLFPGASFVGCGDIRTSSVTNNSQDCRPGVLFAAIRGHRIDGHGFISKALERGASALLVERPQAIAAVPQCIVPDTRRAYAELCAALYGDPSKTLGVAGVTGTNGKTTITWLIRRILQVSGLQTGVLGTIEYCDGVMTKPSQLTTPNPEQTSAWLAAMVRQRTTHVAMELSSHALEQNRTAGTGLDVAILSNITQDHFDYHENYAAYRASKARIFGHLKPGGLAVLNADEPSSLSCRESCTGRVVTYGIDSRADVSAILVEQNLSGSRFQLQINGECVGVHTPLIGRHNVSNCLAAAVAASHFGLSPAQIATGIEALTSVPGRMEAVECGQPFGVFVDYAHTPDALGRCITALRQLAAGRVICVFGAGGDRDRTKRPLLGAAGARADIAVLTSDNPRTEDPEQIMRDVLAGIPAGLPRPHTERNREQAIRWALAQAEPGDCVLVAGKGHETEQILGTERIHFDDREVIRNEFRRVPHSHMALPRDTSRILPRSPQSSY